MNTVQRLASYSHLGRFIFRRSQPFLPVLPVALFFVRNKWSNMDLIPKDVRGMTELDKSKFIKKITVPSVRVSNQNVKSAMKVFKKYLLKLSKFQSVIEADESKKKFLLDPLLFSDVLQLTDDEKAALAVIDVTDDSFSLEELELEYDNFRVDDVLKAVLPEGKEGCTSYSRIGHIAHLNLKEHLLPFKHLIGQVLIDKLVGVTTVVNKSHVIDSTYRNFKMEVLAGNPDFVAQVKENSCTFKFDFSAVYWNSRLCTEHERVVKLLPEGCILFDVFAGVGPFAIPAAKLKKCRVLANDLNPASHQWLVENVRLNKVTDRVETFNLDGRDFIRAEMKKLLDVEEREKPIHVTMNLPALAVEFLDAFIGLLSHRDPGPARTTNPIVHVYSFCAESSAFSEMRSKVEARLGSTLPDDHIIELLDVRDVAPNKHMIRLSFRMPQAVLSSLSPEKENANVSEPKRIKLDGAEGAEAT